MAKKCGTVKDQILNSVAKYATLEDAYNHSREDQDAIMAEFNISQEELDRIIWELIIELLRNHSE